MLFKDSLLPHLESFDALGSIIYQQDCKEHQLACQLYGFYASPQHDCIDDISTFNKKQAEKLDGYAGGVL